MLEDLVGRDPTILKLKVTNPWKYHFVKIRSLWNYWYNIHSLRNQFFVSIFIIVVSNKKCRNNLGTHLRKEHKTFYLLRLHLILSPITIISMSSIFAQFCFVFFFFLSASLFAFLARQHCWEANSKHSCVGKQ